jgi:hypothetical protein
MNHTTIIRIAVIILLTIAMMIAGTYFSTMVQQHQAYSSSGAVHQVRSNEDERSQQHMDQENLCLSAGKCNNSNVGEQTLGNDNSVTGFTDQSKNVQAAVTPTPTPTLTSILPSTTLEIFKRCIPSCPESTFSIRVTGPNNPQPSSFSLKDGGVQFVLFGGGTSFKIVESPVAGFNPPLFTFPPRQGDCRALPGEFQAFGTISPGLNAICVITNIKSR